jgi:hypothetical protein
MATPPPTRSKQNEDARPLDFTGVRRRDRRGSMFEALRKMATVYFGKQPPEARAAADEIAARAEARPTLLGSANQRFVFQLYLDLLGRSPDPAGLKRWTRRLNLGLPRAALVQRILSSAEYREALGRAADREHGTPPARIGPEGSTGADGQEANRVIPDLHDRPVYRKLIISRLAPDRPVVALGTAAEIAAWKAELLAQGRQADGVEWAWDSEIDLRAVPDSATLLICPVPGEGWHWPVIRRLKQRFGQRVVSLPELVLPFTMIEKLRSLLPYYEPTLEGLVSHYLGERFCGRMEELVRVFPLRGKKVIEFGPFDGSQTGGLVRSGAESVTCVEARPENAVKTLAAVHAMGWDNVRVVMDDFHNADDVKYGHFDLAFAHGVYYHSMAPFLFLENLLSLADNVFVGGFCSTDDRPAGDYVTLTYEGESYRAKPYAEQTELYTAGVNPTSYFFNGDDLLAFFRRRGWAVRIISDYTPWPHECTGRFLQFLATRAG